MSDIAYYLSAVVGQDRDSLEVRTKEFSAANLKRFINEKPAAITFGPQGMWRPDRLLEAFSQQNSPLLQRAAGRNRVSRWSVYKRRADDLESNQVSLLEFEELSQQLEALRKAADPSVAWLSEGQLDMELLTAIDSAIDGFQTRRMASGSGGSDERANRQAVRAAREAMLREVATFSSEELAYALDSTTTNASQCAADQRTSGKIFGVRFGREWRYPKFQFDTSHKPIEPYAEMRPLLIALAPDERGWDRLQWFLQPHETLNGSTPLSIWTQDRAAVLKAAKTERWDGRD